MNFENASVLDFNRTNNFFDSDFRFGANTSYSVEGYLLDLSNTAGVSGVLEASEFFRTGLQDYQDITINGENFGKGRVSNFSVNESDWVKYTTYNLSIEGFESGNLSNFTGSYYSGVSQISGQLAASYLLEEFSEDFNFDRSDDTYSYSHSINVKYGSGDNILISPIDRAKALATYIMTSAPKFGLIDSEVSGMYDNNYKEYFSENIDQINNTYSVSKTFNSLNPSGDYSLTLSHSFDLNEQGITNVSEDCNIKVHTTPKKTALVSAIATEIAKSYNRCLDVFNAYSSSTAIKSTALSTNKSINNFNGEGGYNVVYTNDPAFNNIYTWIYTHQIDKNGSFYTVSEEGDIQGLGKDSSTKFSNAESIYPTIKAGIAARLNSYYSDFGNGTLYLSTKSENKNQFNGNIGYNHEYTDEPSHSENGLRKLEISVEDSLPVDLANTFEILGYREMIQSAGTTTLGQRSLQMNMIGERGSELSNILTIADTKCGDYIPDGNDVYIADARYSLNQNDNVVDVNIVWNFNRVSRETEQL